MYRALILLFCSVPVAGADGQLQRLADANRLFELRRAVQQADKGASDTLFYRGLTASAFGHEAAGIEMLRNFLSTNPERATARKAREEIAAALKRLGRYGDAAEELKQALLLTPADDPERAGTENDELLMASLSGVDPTTVEFGGEVATKATRNRLGSWDVPVQVNGVAGEWIFDTGANVSTLSESEARRMKLTVLESKAYVTGSTAQKNSLRLAVANELQFGPAKVRNVVFLVLADDALAIKPLRYQITGILGLPVLRALGRVGIAKSGSVRIHPQASTASSLSEPPNLFFDDASPLVEIAHEGHVLQMFLDTGANTTALYPSFRSALAGQETARLRTKREKTAGAGGMIQRETAVVPGLRIEIGGAALKLKNLSLQSEMPAGSSRFRDGVAGMDLLWSGFLLDFDAMKLTMDAAR